MVDTADQLLPSANNLHLALFLFFCFCFTVPILVTSESTASARQTVAPYSISLYARRMRERAATATVTVTNTCASLRMFKKKGHLLPHPRKSYIKQDQETGLRDGEKTIKNSRSPMFAGR